jgi:lysophospholipase L1-like esterase
MSLFTQDSFTDTPGVLLENHTGETGAVWTKNPAFSTGSAAITAAGRLRGNATNGVYYESAVPASADYDVEADLYVASVVGSAGLTGRQDPTGFTFYLLDYEAAGSFHLYTQVAGTAVNTTSFAMALTVGQIYHLRLSMRGGQISCYVNGALVISITDTNITSAGRAGLYLGEADTDSTGFQLDNFTGAIPVTVNVTDANLFFSPYNWQSDGAGAMQPGNVKASSTFAQSNTPGAYMKFTLNAASAGAASLLLDTSPLNGITAGNCPTLAISVDGQAFVSQLLVYATGTTRLFLAGNLAAGTHTVLIFFRSVTTSSSLAMGDRWNTPASVVKVTGLELDGKGSATATQTPQPKRILIFGDSITEGANAVGNSDANSDQDATQTYCTLLGTGLGAEVGIIGFSGQGWAVAGYGNVPRFYDTATPANSTFDKYLSGTTRLAGGVFVPAPDDIIVLQGRNDATGGATDSAVTAAVSAWIAAARADAPLARINVIIPIDGSKRSAISAGVTAAADANTFLIDLGAAIEPTFISGGVNTNDGIHPNVRGHATVAAMLMFELEAGGTGSFAGSTGEFIGGEIQLSEGAFAV